MDRADIDALLAHAIEGGATTEEAALMVGLSPSTCQRMMTRARRINPSFPRPQCARRARRDCVATGTLDPATLARLREAAKARRITVAAVAARLLDALAEEAMFDALLDGRFYEWGHGR